MSSCMIKGVDKMVIPRGRDKSVPIAALRHAKIQKEERERDNSYLKKNLAAAIHKNIRDLVDCGSGAKGDDVQQLERFYTVPLPRPGDESATMQVILNVP